MGEGRIERLRPHWKLVVLATLAALAGIWICKLDYTSVQLASTPVDFAERVQGESGRTMAAGAFDVLFALGYGALGLIGLRAHARGRTIATWAVLLVVVGVIGDIVENVLVIANAAQVENLHERMIDAMGLAGLVKWAAQVGNLVLLALMAANWSADRRREGA